MYIFIKIIKTTSELVSLYIKWIFFDKLKKPLDFGKFILNVNQKFMKK